MADADTHNLDQFKDAPCDGCSLDQPRALFPGGIGTLTLVYDPDRSKDRNQIFLMSDFVFGIGGWCIGDTIAMVPLCPLHAPAYRPWDELNACDLCDKHEAKNDPDHDAIACANEQRRRRKN